MVGTFQDVKSVTTIESFALCAELSVVRKEKGLQIKLFKKGSKVDPISQPLELSNVGQHYDSIGSYRMDTSLAGIQSGVSRYSTLMQANLQVMMMFQVYIFPSKMHLTLLRD